MTQYNGLNRRSFFAMTAAAASVATSGGAAVSVELSEAAAPRAVSANWSQATFDDLSALVGDRFRVTAPDGRAGVMTLVDVEPVVSGAARPADLPRPEGVVAVFDSPDMDMFIGAEHAIHRVSHGRLGTADLFLGRSPRQSGGHVIELVLN